MRSPYGLREAPGLEEDEAQQHRVPHAGPDGPHQVAARGDTLHQHGVDRHADHDKHPLEPYGEKGLEIVVPHVPGLPVGDSGEGDRGKAGHQVNLYHAPIDNDEHHDIQGRHGELHEEGLQEYPQQGAKLHCLKLGLHVLQRLRRDGGGALYQPRRLLHYMLGHVKYRHDDIEGVGEHQHGGEGLENPFKENPGVEVVEVVVVHQHLDELIGHHECQHQPRYGEDDGFGELAYHGEHPGVPCRRGHPYLCRDLSDLLVHPREEPAEVLHDTPDQKGFEPFRDGVEDTLHRSLLWET